MAKFPVWIMRFSVIIQNMHEGFNFIRENIINTSRIDICTQNQTKIDEFLALNENIELIRSIPLTIVEMAYNLASYFMKHYLILSQYSYAGLDENEDIFKILKAEITQPKKKCLLTPTSKYDELTEKIVKKVMLDPNTTVSLKTVNWSIEKADAKIIEEKFKLMHQVGLGTRVSRKNRNGPPSQFFTKISIADMSEDLGLLKKLMEFRIDPQDILEKIKEYKDNNYIINQTATDNPTTSSASQTNSKKPEKKNSIIKKRGAQVDVEDGDGK
jgi:hypothetical protein